MDSCDVDLFPGLTYLHKKVLIVGLMHNVIGSAAIYIF